MARCAALGGCCAAQTVLLLLWFSWIVEGCHSKDKLETRTLFICTAVFDVHMHT